MFFQRALEYMAIIKDFHQHFVREVHDKAEFGVAGFSTTTPNPRTITKSPFTTRINCI